MKHVKVARSSEEKNIMVTCEGPGLRPCGLFRLVEARKCNSKILARPCQSSFIPHSLGISLECNVRKWLVVFVRGSSIRSSLHEIC